MQAHLPRVSSLIATSPQRVHTREVCQSLASFRPQVFSTSRRFPPRFGFAGLFHPASHVQGCRRSGASLPAQPRALIERRFLLAVVVRSPHRRCRDVHLSASATPTDCRAPHASTSRPSSARGSVAYGLEFSLPAARSPLRFSSPPGRKPPPWFWFPKTSAHGVSTPSAFLDGGLGFSVSLETNLHETFEPSDQSLHGGLVRRGSLRVPF
jgi:hypothetical protein